MGNDFVSTVAVEAIAFACPSTVILVISDDFDEALKATEVRWHVIAQVDQYIFAQMYPGIYGYVGTDGK